MHLIHLLEAWANVNSYSHNAHGLEKMCALAEQAFAELHPDSCERFPSGLFLKKRGDAPLQIFLGGHLDTVFSPDHPFQTTTRLDAHILQGPGVADMKGGVLVMLEALKRFEASKEAENIGWEIFLNLDEEIGSPNSRFFLEECSKRCAVALLFEPTFPDGAFVSARKGSANYEAISTGKAAHMGRHPEEGKNAIYALCHYVSFLETLNKAGSDVHVGLIEGGVAQNVIPPHARAQFNVRSWDVLDETLNAAAKKMGITLKRTSYRPPKPFDKKTKSLFETLKKCGKGLGLDITWRETGGVCDGNTFGAAGVPTIDTLGVLGSGIHTEKECVHLPSLEEKITLTYTLLMEITQA